jgi:hypothetical protein
LLPHKTLRVSNGSCKASDILSFHGNLMDGIRMERAKVMSSGYPKSFPSKALHLTSLPISSTAAWHNLTRGMLQFNSQMTSDELHWDMTSDTFKPFLAWDTINHIQFCLLKPDFNNRSARQTISTDKDVGRGNFVSAT